MPGKQVDLPRGTPDMLTLKALGLGAAWVSHRAADPAGDASNLFQVKPGSLFPALHRMEEKGWLSPSWGESENSRRAKYYELTRLAGGNLRQEQRPGNRFRSR